jgi:AcrR family transcriptional regulator
MRRLCGMRAAATDAAPELSPESASLPPRERILAAAGDLFYRNGVRAVGVDAIIATGGVAKASFYRHFRSKDELVAAWLLSPQPRWLDRVVVETEHRASSPRARLLAFFDVLLEFIDEPGSAGCPYLNTAAELHDPEAPIRSAIEDYLSEVEAYLRGLAEAGGGPAPHSLALQLRLVAAGAFITAVAVGRHEQLDSATKQAAAALVAAGFEPEDSTEL